jgi:sulfite exporter TauE/SafE
VAALAAAAFAAGLLGGVHCAGMCGGIVGTLALQARGPLVARQLAFNGGRILSYVLAGTLAGSASAVALGVMPLASVRIALFAVANVLMVLLGLYVAGWSSLPRRIEALGGRLWRRIQPHASRLLPLDSWPRALGAGMLWGWVPCGLVYSMLALAFASGGPVEGALVMAAFGAGTLPTLLAAGMAAQRLGAMRRLPWVRYTAGIAIAALGAIGLARVPGLAEALVAGWHCVK